MHFSCNEMNKKRLTFAICLQMSAFINIVMFVLLCFVNHCLEIINLWILKS